MLLPRGFAATFSLVVEEEKPHSLVVEEEKSSMVLLPRWFAATISLVVEVELMSP